MLNSETVCKLIATLLIPASTVQMISGTSIVYSAILSVCYLKKKLYRHQYLGILLITIGIVLVGLACFYSHHHNQDSKEHSNFEILIGIVFL